ncbi:MAG TPA: serine/threonine-protein kinase [Holophagaceae bacterium]
MLTRLGKFEIVRLLAQGSMGEVYVGRDPLLGREVAIKVIQASASLGPEARERFAMEARAAGLLNHPNIVTVHEMGEEQGVLYLAMELVKGEDLGTLLHTGTLTPRDVLEVLAQVCDGLAVAHRHQVLHRDIKPSNIRVVWDGQHLQAKILDFGVAKVFNSDTTDEGTVFGTVNYMAPEYLQSGRPDARSDLFAVGVILYEALAGVPPFDGPSPGSVIYRLLHESPVPLPPTAFQGISRDIQGILAHALAKDPANRFQTAEDLGAVLRQARDPGWRWDRERPTMAIKVKRGGDQPLEPLLHSSIPAPPTPPKGTPRPRPAARPALRPGEVARPAASPRAFTPRPDLPRGPLTSERGTGSGLSASAAAQRAATEVRRDVLETTRLQLVQALELDPANPRTRAMLVVTLYRLGRFDAVMQAIREARNRGIPGHELRAVTRCRQVIEEEERAGRLPFEQHAEFLDYLGA